MITLLTGENSYEAEQALRQIVAGFDGEPEKFDGSELELRQLPDLLMGLSLFAQKRLVIIRDLSASKQAWEALPELLERISDDIHLVLIEPSVDKRLKTYKTLKKAADVKEFSLLTERESSKAEQWAKEETKRMGMTLDGATVKELVKRCLIMPEKGPLVIDQWQVRHALEKLSVFDEVTVATVQQYIDEQPVDSVFGIFETALRGNREVLHQLLRDIEPREDPFRVFGLLSGQVFQLAALAASDESTTDTAKAIGLHPYAAGKLAPLAKKYSKQQVKHIVEAFAEADSAMKLSKAGPWVLIEQALMKVARAASAK